MYACANLIEINAYDHDARDANAMKNMLTCARGRALYKLLAVRVVEARSRARIRVAVDVDPVVA